LSGPDQKQRAIVTNQAIEAQGDIGFNTAVLVHARGSGHDSETSSPTMGTFWLGATLAARNMGQRGLSGSFSRCSVGVTKREAGVLLKIVVPPRNPACREFRSGTFVYLHHLHLLCSYYITWSCLHHLLEHSKNQRSRNANTANPLVTFGR